MTPVVAEKRETDQAHLGTARRVLRNRVRFQPRGRQRPCQRGQRCRREEQMYDDDFKDKESEFDDGFGEGDAVGNSSGEHEHSKSDYECRVLACPFRVCLLVKHAVLVH
jgi:hypothetical protein